MSLTEKIFSPDYSFFFMIGALSINTCAMVYDNAWLWLILIPVYIIESWIQYKLSEEYEDEE